MKKRLFFGLIILLIGLFVLSFAFAEDVNSASDVPSGGDIKGTLGDVGGGINNATNEFLETDIVLPGFLKVPARIVFGLKEEIDLQNFIVLVALWVMLFLVLQAIVSVTPMFSGKKSWVIAFLVNIIIGFTGVLKIISNFIFDFGNFFGFLEKWGPLKLAFSIIIVVVIFFILKTILKFLKETLEIGKSVSEGIEAGVGIAKLKAMNEASNLKS